MIKKLQNLSTSQMHKLLTLLSIALALQVNYIQHGWINDDSVLYFEVARLFAIGEWKQGVALFNWPLYPLLISVIHKTLSASFQASAILLNVLFFAISTFSFVSLIRLSGGNKNTVLCGVFLLFSSSYITGSVLPMLLRDQGFWAAFLTSLVFFIRFYRENKLYNALLWQISAIIAMLFRIEAITFLVCLPLLILFKDQCALKEKLKQFVLINIIPILAFTSIAITLLTSPSIQLNDFGRLQEVITIFPRMMTSISKAFEVKAAIMGKDVLGSYFADYGLMGVILTLIGILSIKIINLTSWPIIGIFALSYKNSRLTRNTDSIHKDSVKILFTVAALGLLNAIVIITSTFVLSNRYIIALGFVVYIFAAFHLSFMLEAFRNKRINNWHKALLIICLTILSFSGIKNILPKGDGYTYEKDAIAYVKQRAINNKVFYVTPRSRYFAGAPYAGRGYDYWGFTESAIKDGSIYQYDYVVINLDIDEYLPERQKTLTAKLGKYSIDKEFYGYRKKKKITIYVKNRNSHSMSSS